MAAARLGSYDAGRPLHQAGGRSSERLVERHSRFRSTHVLGRDHRFECPRSDDPTAVADNLRRELDASLGRRRRSHDPEAAKIEQKLIVRRKTFHRPRNGTDVVRRLEALDDLFLEYLRNGVTPLGILWRFPGTGIDDDPLAVKATRAVGSATTSWPFAACLGGGNTRGAVRS